MTQQLDPVSVATTVAGILMAPALAELVGPYAIILLAATTGAGWSLGRRKPDAVRSSALLYYLRLNGTAVLITVGIATGVTKIWPQIDGINWMLGPIGLLVGGVGDDWPAVARWLVGRIGRRIDGPSGGAQ